MRFPAATLTMALAGAALAVPMGAWADAPAVSAPAMPAPFIGAPTNDDPVNGQFTVNFDDQGRFLGVGTAPEHLSNFDLSQERGHAQSRGAVSKSEAAAGNAIFSSFRQRLRDVSAPRAALAGRSRS